MTTADLLRQLLQGLAASGVQPVLQRRSMIELVAEPAVADPRTRLLLSFDVAQFEVAVEELDRDAASLWPDRPALQRAVALMLVHIEEDLATVADGAEETVLALHPGGVARVRAR